MVILYRFPLKCRVFQIQFVIYLICSWNDPTFLHFLSNINILNLHVGTPFFLHWNSSCLFLVCHCCNIWLYVNMFGKSINKLKLSTPPPLFLKMYHDKISDHFNKTFIVVLIIWLWLILHNNLLPKNYQKKNSSDSWDDPFQNRRASYYGLGCRWKTY